MNDAEKARPNSPADVKLQPVHEALCAAQYFPIGLP